MTLREFAVSRDFDIIQNWITDERTHALWCANRMKYPLDVYDMGGFLKNEEEVYGNKAYIAEDDNGKVVGFFCCSPNKDSGENMLKFVIVDPDMRGKGYGSEMISLAVENAFKDETVRAVQLMVFTENVRARKCYENAGFIERSTVPDSFKYKDEFWGRCNMVIFR